MADDEIEKLIEEVERLIKEKNKYAQQARDLFDPLFEDKSFDEILKELSEEHKKLTDRLKPRSQRRAEQFDETIEQFKARRNKPSDKLN